jgi:hypothetical protein
MRAEILEGFLQLDYGLPEIPVQRRDAVIAVDRERPPDRPDILKLASQILEHGRHEIGR